MAVLIPFAHLRVPSLWKPCSADKTDNTDTHVLPHIASEPFDKMDYHMNVIWLRTAKKMVRDNLVRYD